MIKENEFNQIASFSIEELNDYLELLRKKVRLTKVDHYDEDLNYKLKLTKICLNMKKYNLSLDEAYNLYKIQREEFKRFLEEKTKKC
ncbi:MAG: hypothetical protein HUJ68_13060 [Clostridia bacterium]|nr:hypothetical protein [Clostridia bacterium]